MGNSGSSDDKKKKDKKKKDKKKNDADGDGPEGFFGNPKLRSIVIGGLLIAFAILQMPAISKQLDYISDANDACNDVCDLLPDDVDCDCFEQQLAGFSLMEIGLILIIVFSIAAIVFQFLSCNDKGPCCGMIVMIGLVLGGVFYILGWWILIEPATSTDNSDYANFNIMVLWSENLFCGFTAIVFGIDCWKNLLNDGKTRMFLQSLIILIILSFLCFIGYAYIGSEDISLIFGINRFCYGDDEIRLIAAAYFFILVASVLYLILYVTKLGNKITQMVSAIIIAIILIAGSIFAAIGYWGGCTCDNDGCDELNSFMTGYIVLLIGICIVNALDMGLYDNAKMAKTVS